MFLVIKFNNVITAERSLFNQQDVFCRLRCCWWCGFFFVVVVAILFCFVLVGLTLHLHSIGHVATF
jgi:hypothetical protein